VVGLRGREPAVGREAHVGQTQRRIVGVVAVAPLSGVRVETEVGQQPVAVRGDQVDGVDEVVADGVADEVVEVDAGPAGLDAVAVVHDLVEQGVGGGRVDGEQTVAVRPGARAAAAGLDAEEVVEQGDDIGVVQVGTLAVADAERDDGQPSGAVVAEDLDPGVAVPVRQRPPPVTLLGGLDGVGAYGLLEGEDQSGMDGLDDRRGAALLSGDRVVEVAVAERVDKGDGAAAGRGGHPVADQLTAHDEDPRGVRAADELVRGPEQRVLVVARAGTALSRPGTYGAAAA
jgi:hypothetical protein